MSEEAERAAAKNTALFQALAGALIKNGVIDRTDLRMQIESRLRSARPEQSDALRDAMQAVMHL